MLDKLIVMACSWFEMLSDSFKSRVARSFLAEAMTGEMVSSLACGVGRASKL